MRNQHLLVLWSRAKEAFFENLRFVSLLADILLLDNPRFSSKGFMFVLRLYFHISLTQSFCIVCALLAKSLIHIESRLSISFLLFLALFLSCVHSFSYSFSRAFVRSLARLLAHLSNVYISNENQNETQIKGYSNDGASFPAFSIARKLFRWFQREIR